MNYKLLIIMCLSLGIQMGFSKSESQKRTEGYLSSLNDKLDLYLLIGQSNMAGRSPITDAVKDTLKNVYLFTGDSWIPAANPLNKYSTVRGPLSMQKLGPGYSLGKELAIETGRKIGLVVNAKGATKIEWWQKGYVGPNDFDLYENAIKQVKKADKYGTLKAIVWHQGEQNSRMDNPDDYLLLLESMVNDLRHDLGKNIYFIAGETSQWNQVHTKINEQIYKIPDKIKNADFVSSDGLEPLNGDTSNPHFDTKSQIILGQRYAKKILEHIYGITLPKEH